MICFSNNELIVQGYDKLLKVSEDEIVLIAFKKTIVILGSSLSLPFFEKDEFIIKGNINEIKLYEN